jgi:hypothetical protein
MRQQWVLTPEHRPSRRPSRYPSRELHVMNREEWMTPDQAARHLNFTSTKAFQEVVAKESVPKHYLSDRLPR